MIQTLAPHTAQEPFADRVGLWGSYWCLDDFDPFAFCNPCETLSVLPVIVPYQKTGSCFVWRRCPYLLATQKSPGDRVTPY